MELGTKKVDRMNKQGKEDRVAQLEEKVRALQAGSGGGKVRHPETSNCNTCRPEKNPDSLGTWPSSKKISMQNV